MPKMTEKAKHSVDAEQFATDLLRHYDNHARILPWRSDEQQNPYNIWISEIMLQQTTVATVIGYFEKFLKTFPTVEKLAAADEQDVLHLWQGLGYYSRARNLHKCAKEIAKNHNSTFPNSYDELLKLPGIGPYTAAAIAAIAFNQPETVVDGNVERVITRLYNIQTPLPDSKKEIKEKAIPLTSKNRAGDYAGAIMDLGATICTPKSPKCDICPVIKHCRANNLQTAAELPHRRRKAAKPKLSGTAWIFLDAEGRIFLQKRPEKGLLGNLWEVPSEGWEDEKRNSVLPHHLASHCNNYVEGGRIRHIFTHFSLELDVRITQIEETKEEWFNPASLPPLPTLMKKVLAQLS